MDNDAKQEYLQTSTPPHPVEETVTLIDLCSGGDDSGLVEQDVQRRYNSGGAKRPRGSSALDMNNAKKKPTADELKFVLPEGFGPSITTEAPSGRVGSCKQFWKAGDYEGAPGGNWDLSSGKTKFSYSNSTVFDNGSIDTSVCTVCLLSQGGFDHVRVHPKFLHSNATSHKWALGGTLSFF